jgi:Bacterial Ig domain
MVSIKRASLRSPLLAVAAVAAFVAACSSAAPTPIATVGNKPTVVVQSPTNGAVLAVGANVAVTGAATDTVGVDHVALFADGVSVASSAASSPAAQPGPLVSFSLTWLATPAGPHVLQVIAYRADGTPSDPSVINVTVGAGASQPIVSGGSLPPFSFAPASQPVTTTPKPTKKPRPTSPPPTPTPPQTPTPIPTVLPSADTNGYAPDDIDNEPYEIALVAHNTQCPAVDTGGPITASGCIWEQISAPNGDTSDDLEFTQAPNTWYHVVLTSCSDTSDATVWGPTGDSSSTLGCKDFLDKQSSGGNPGSFPITVDFPSTVTSQTYNLYQLTVYQCKFANCASQ